MRIAKIVCLPYIYYDEICDRIIGEVLHMKYGIYYAYWVKEWDVDYRPYIDKAAALGFDILEVSCIPIMKQTDDELRELLKYAKDKNVILTGGYGPAKEHNIASEDPQTVKRAIDFYKEALRKMNILEMKSLCGGIYSYWPVDYSQPIDKKGDYERSIVAMKEIAKIGEQYDVMLCAEVLNRFEGYLLNDCEEALAYVKAVDHPNVKVHLDTFHMSIEEDSLPDAIRRAGSYLGHMHVGERNRKVPGKGNLPWFEIGQALKDINYQGAAVFEPFVQSGGAVGQDIKIFRELINDLTEEKLDDDLGGSLEFLKHTFAM